MVWLDDTLNQVVGGSAGREPATGEKVKDTVALRMSLSFADDVKVEGSINLPTINMVLPTTASMIMNPYELNVKLNPRDPDETPVDDQIIR